MRTPRALVATAGSMVALAALFAACGEPFGNEPPCEDCTIEAGADASLADAEASADVTTDAGITDATDAADAASGRCDPAVDFSIPSPVSEITGDVQSAWVSPDERHIYLAMPSTDGGGSNYEFVYGTRATTAQPFGSLSTLTALSTPSNDLSIAFTADELNAYIVSAAENSVRLVQRATPTSAFGARTPITGLPTVFNGWITAGGGALYYSIYDIGSSKYALWRAPLTAPATSGQPKLLAELVPAIDSLYDGIVATADEREVFFTHSTSQGVQIFEARRSEVTKPFGDTNPTTLNEAGAENRPVSVSPDGCVIYITRYSPVTGRRSLWRATRPK